MSGSPRKQVYVPYANTIAITLSNHPHLKQILQAPMLQPLQLHLQRIHQTIKYRLYL